MKKTFLSLFSLLLILNLVIPMAAASESYPDFDTAVIDTFIEEEMRTSRIPGLALGIVKNGEIAYLKSYGHAGNGRTLTPQTPFLIGSLSKSITAVATMQLVEADLLNLDAPIREYLPWFEMAGEYDVSTMTVRHLLVQTSGIPWNAGLTTLAEDSSLALEEEIRALKDIALVHPPGEQYIYSNTNYNILGLIVEKVSEQGYMAHVENDIFKPLEMQDSYLSKNDGIDGGMSEGHLKWFSFPVATDVQYLDNSLAAGFIISSAEDMSRYLLMHLGEGSYKQSMLLSETGAAELHTPGEVTDGESEYAMGLVVREVDGASLIMHDGATQGFNSGMIFSPEDQWGIVVLTNFAGQLELPAMGIALGVADILQGNSPETDSRTRKMVYLGLLMLLIILIAFTIRSIILLPKKWAVKIKENRPRGFFPVFGRIVLPAGLELLVPYLIFIFIPASAGFSIWNLFMLFHPDLVYSLLLLAALMLAKALWRIYLLLRIRSN